MHLLHALKLFIMDKLKKKKKTPKKNQPKKNPEDLSQQIIILATIFEKKVQEKYKEKSV